MKIFRYKLLILCVALAGGGCSLVSDADKPSVSRLIELSDGLAKETNSHFDSIIENQGTPDCRTTSKTNSAFWEMQGKKMKVIEARARSLNDPAVSAVLQTLSSNFEGARNDEIQRDLDFKAGITSNPCITPSDALEYDTFLSGTLKELSRLARVRTHIQNMTTAARAQAERKMSAARS